MDVKALVAALVCGTVLLSLVIVYASLVVGARYDEKGQRR